MKLKKDSLKTLFLVFFPMTVVWASNVDLPKSRRLANAVEGGQDVTFKLNVLSKDILKDPLLPKEIPEVVTSFGEPSGMIAGNEVNDCKLSSRFLAQISKPTTSEWFVDNYTMSLLRGDLQLIIDCTRPQDRIVFVTSQLIRVVRTLKIVHELEFFGTSLYKYKAEQGGHELVSFTCPHSGPVFSIYATKFTGTNLNITHCVQPSNSAAIVLEESANVTLNQLTFKGNSNRAIWVKAGANLILNECDLEDNKYTGNGGAIFVEGDSKILVSRSNFKRNSVSNGHGGVIYFNGSNIVVVKKSTFTDNAASNYGGVMYFDSGNEVHIEGSTFPYNSAKCDGGVIYAARSNTLNLLTSTFANNLAQCAGGVGYLYRENKLTIRACRFANNKAKGNAGGVRLYADNALSVLTSIFTNNTCGHYGGAIAAFENSILIVRRSILSNNVAGKSGGGVNMNTSNSLTTIDSTFIHNIAVDGGALILYKSNVLVIEGCALNDNTAKNYGGAINLDSNNKGAIFDSSLSNNHAGHTIGPYGAAIYFKSSSNSLLLSNTKITSNKKVKTVAAYHSFSKSISRRCSFKGITF